MGWKNWPYWLKGGVLGGIIGVLSQLFLYFSYIILGSIIKTKYAAFAYLIILYLSMPFSFITTLVNYNDAGSTGDIIFNLIIMFFTVPLNFALIGLLIGFIIGKIKSRKQAISS